MRERRLPGAVLVGALLLAGSVGVAAWSWHRGGDAPAPAPEPEPLDVVGTGRVDAAGPVVALEPAVAGRVQEVLVKEGDRVEAGQLLLRQDADQAQVRLLQAEAACEAAEVELAAARGDAGRFAGQVEARRLLLDAAAARLAGAKALARQRREQESVAPLGAAERDGIEARLREAELTESAERAGFDDLRKIDPQLRVRLAEARRRAAEGDRDLARKGVAECDLKAPGAGTVFRVAAAAGMLLAPGSPGGAIIFAPAGPLIVRAEVEQEFLPDVFAGQEARVADDGGGAGPEWRGRVKRVAEWVAPRRALLLDPGELSDVRTAECVIELAPGAPGLRVGQRVRVRLVRAPTAAANETASGRAVAAPGRRP